VPYLNGPMSTNQWWASGNSRFRHAWTGSSIEETRVLEWIDQCGNRTANMRDRDLLHETYVLTPGGYRLLTDWSAGHCVLREDPLALDASDSSKGAGQ
jgi:hypothetical protein